MENFKQESNQEQQGSGKEDIMSVDSLEKELLDHLKKLTQDELEKYPQALKYLGGESNHYEKLHSGYYDSPIRARW